MSSFAFVVVTMNETVSPYTYSVYLLRLGKLVLNFIPLLDARLSITYLAVDTPLRAGCGSI